MTPNNYMEPSRNRYFRTSRPGFTLVEIVISLMILGFGLLSVIALTLAGAKDAQVAIGMSTAYATARTALYDPTQVDPAKSATDSPIRGFVNGYFVSRTILQASVSQGIDLVQVKVYWGDSGQVMAGLVSLVRR